jgi:Cu-processing system permease protein
VFLWRARRLLLRAGFGISPARFGPSLLSPGRIEHLLALPVRRCSCCSDFAGASRQSLLGALYGRGVA